MSRFVVFGEKNDYARNVWQTSGRVMMKGLDLLTAMRCHRKPCLLPTVLPSAAHTRCPDVIDSYRVHKIRVKHNTY